MTPSNTQEIRHIADAVIKRVSPHAQAQGESRKSTASASHAGRPGSRTLRLVASSEVVEIIRLLTRRSSAESEGPNTPLQEGVWTSECGEVTIETKEPQQDALRFFIQDPDDYYVEYLLNYRNYLVFAHRDLVWTHVESPMRKQAAVETEIPAACWHILSEAVRETNKTRSDRERLKASTSICPSSRPALGQLLRAG